MGKNKKSFFNLALFNNQKVQSIMEKSRKPKAAHYAADNETARGIMVDVLLRYPNAKDQILGSKAMKQCNSLPDEKKEKGDVSKSQMINIIGQCREIVAQKASEYDSLASNYEKDFEAAAELIAELERRNEQLHEDLKNSTGETREVVKYEVTSDALRKFVGELSSKDFKEFTELLFSEVHKLDVEVVVKGWADNG